MRTLISIISAVFALSATTLFAADISPGPEGQCQLRLSGEIFKGDFQKLENQLGAFVEQVGSATNSHVLCVSGPGGNIVEAMKIAALLYEKGISTRIEAGQSCVSSCSIIFMMGTVYWPEGSGNGHHASRKMHVTSELGFHRPALKIDAGGIYKTTAVVKSFDLAVQATLEFVRLANFSSEIGTMMFPDLIENMFTHRGEDFYFIKTTGQTARWQIELDGFEPPSQMDPQAALTTCDNLATWQLRYQENGIKFSDAKVTYVDSPAEGPIFKVVGPYGKEFEFQCLVQLATTERGLWIRACGMPANDSVYIGDGLCEKDERHIFYTGPEQLRGDSIFEQGANGFDRRALLPASTLLTHASAVARRIEARAQAYLAVQKPERPMAYLRMACAGLTGPVQVTNVTNFVNMRSDPGFGGSVVGEIPLGTPMVPASNGLFWSNDQTDMDEECESLCRSVGNREMSGAEWQGLNQCFEANRFWYRVNVPNGATGFISGKFLRYYDGKFPRY